MKKLFALMLALCLMLGCTALADVEVNWEDVEDAVEGGDFVTIEELGLDIWIPDDYVDMELDESYTSVGYFKLFGAEDGSGAVAFQYIEAAADVDLLEAVNAIEGASGAESMIINGLPCVNFDLLEQNASCLAFNTQKGNILVITFAPISSDDFKAKAQFIMASIQSAE